MNRPEIINVLRASYPIIFLHVGSEEILKLEKIRMEFYQTVKKPLENIFCQWSALDGFEEYKLQIAADGSFIEKLQQNNNFSVDLPPTEVLKKFGDPRTVFDQGIKLSREEQQQQNRALADAFPILIFKGADESLEDPNVRQAIKNILPNLDVNGRQIIFITDAFKVHPDFKDVAVLLDSDLPSEEEINELIKVMDSTMQDSKIKVNKKHIEALKGLPSVTKVKNTLSKSIVKFGKLDIPTLEEGKLEAVNSCPGLEIYKPVNENEIGGLENLKNYIKARKDSFRDTKNLLKGILLVGIPGTGKSQMAKVIASILEVPLIKFNINDLKDSLQGNTEKNMKLALRTIESIGNSVIWIDEIEKAIGGVQSSNRTDGGTTSNMFGQLLTWMQEHESKTYFVATCNEISDLMNISQGALLRRFDDIFYSDIPNSEEKKEIIDIMNKRYSVKLSKDEKFLDKIKFYTGAEIEKLAIASKFEPVDYVIEHGVKPIALLNYENLKESRAWAAKYCRYASKDTSQIDIPAVYAENDNNTTASNNNSRKLK
jgi:hypothetical protein